MIKKKLLGDLSPGNVEGDRFAFEVNVRVMFRGYINRFDEFISDVNDVIQIIEDARKENELTLQYEFSTYLMSFYAVLLDYIAYISNSPNLVSWMPFLMAKDFRMERYDDDTWITNITSFFDYILSFDPKISVNDLYTKVQQEFVLAKDYVVEEEIWLIEDPDIWLGEDEPLKTECKMQHGDSSQQYQHTDAESGMARKEENETEDAKPKRKSRKLTYLKADAIKYIGDQGGSTSKENYDAWVQSISPKDGSDWIEGINYPRFSTWRSWYTHAK